MGSATSKQPDEQFAEAIQRMHNIFRDCDGEFRNLSAAANTHGKESNECRAAADALQRCQRRRVGEFQIMEARCGPAQEAYKLCTQMPENQGRAFRCLPVLHAYLDCAEEALRQPQAAAGTAAAAAAAAAPVSP